MTSNTFVLGLLTLFVLLAPIASSQAQSTPAAIDPAVANLARRIGEPLQKKKVKRVFVTDLRGPNGEEHPVGKWLADQLSSSLEKDFPELQIIERPGKSSIAGDDDHPEDESNQSAFKKEKELARKLGASVIVAGSFAKVPQGIGISLFADSVSDSPRWFGEASGLVPYQTKSLPYPLIRFLRRRIGLPELALEAQLSPDASIARRQTTARRLGRRSFKAQ